MRFFKRFLSITLLISILIGCSASSKDPNTAFRHFTFSLFQSEVTSTTINLQYSLRNPEKYDITSAPITFGTFDFDPLSTKAYLENLTAALHSFPYEALSKENQLTYDVLSYYINASKNGSCFYLYEEPLSPLTGIHAQLPVLLAEYPFYDEEDIETYLELLRTLPEYFESLIRFEKVKSNSGLFMADEVADEVIAQCDAFVKMGDENYLLSTFEERVAKLNAEKYISENQRIVKTVVLPAYNHLANAISSLKGTGTNQNGLCHYPDGTKYYEHLVKCSTGSDRSVKELQKLIRGQIALDTLDMQNALEENPSLFTESTSLSLSPKEMLHLLQHEIQTSFPASVPVNLELKQVPNALEEYLSPAFYLIPPIDYYSNNTIYLNDFYHMDDISLFTTLAHEGYPGHLYQTTYYAATDPDPIRKYLSFNGYVEGWATYAEMCSYYISPLQKPLATFLQKNNSIILGLYAAADIGIHYDGWDEKDTLAFFSSYGIDDQDAISEIYEMILGDPANYLSYYIGYVEILELKKEYKGTQMEFHKELLEIGPAPFDVIEKYIHLH